MSPFRYAVCLINGIERYLDLFEEIHILLLGKRLGCHIQQFCLTRKDIGLYKVN